jgi:WD40 repeat protein
MSDAMESPNGTPISSSSKSSSFFLGGSLPYSNKDEKMMRVAVIKSHSHAISAVTASTDLAEGAAWCIVSGDRVGNVSLSLGVEGSEGTESRSLSLKTSSRIDAVTALCFAEKGSVAGGSASGALSIMDHRSGRVFHEHRVHEGAVTGVLSLRSHEMMTVSRDRTARLWDTRASLKTQDRVIGGARHISAVCAGASWDNYLVACGSANGSIDMFDLRFDLAKPVLTFRGHRGRISSLHFDGVSSGLLRSASTDGCTRLWDSVKNVCMQTNHVYDNHVGVSEMKISSAEERLIDDDLATYATLSSGNRYCITRSFSGVIKVFTI